MNKVIIEAVNMSFPELSNEPSISFETPKINTLLDEGWRIVEMKVQPWNAHNSMPSHIILITTLEKPN